MPTSSLSSKSPSATAAATAEAPAQKAWNECLKIIGEEIKADVFKIWFEPIIAVNLTAGVLTVQVPSSFFYEWLEENYVNLLGKVIRRVLGKGGRLEYQVPVVTANKEHGGTSVKMPATQAARPPARGGSQDAAREVRNPFNANPYAIPGLKRPQIEIDPQLNPDLTFENCVEGDFNRTARSAGYEIAQKPGLTAYNPLVIYGPTGCGKTHIAQAIGNEVLVRHPKKTVLYVSSEKFINQFVDHSRNGDVADFVYFYQMIDVLIIDDIHVLARAPKTQEVLFNIFNHLHQTGKQIVMTTDVPPKDMAGIEGRLLSRFRWGLFTDIAHPDVKERQIIMRRMMKNDGLEMPDDVVRYVATNSEDNVRDLVGALISLFAYSTLNKKEIDLGVAQLVMKNRVKSVAAPSEISMEHIQRVAAEFFEVPFEKVTKRNRQQDIVRVRQTCMALSRRHTAASLKSIGAHFGGYDHTTVMHALKSIDNLLDTDAAFAAQFAQLEPRVLSGVK